MPAHTTGSRLKLGEPLASMLADFREAHYGAPEIRIIREAVNEFIERRLEAEPEMRKRYDAARKRRLNEKGVPLSVVSSDED